ARRAAVLFDVSQPYSRDLAERFRRAFTARGGRIVAFETYTADRAADFRPQLRRIRSARPEVLLLPNFPDAVNRQLSQAESMGLRLDVLGSDSWDPPSLPPLGRGQRVLVTSQWAPGYPTPATRRFVEAYRAIHGREPRSAAAMTYDAVRILLAAITLAQSLEPARVRQAIADMRNYEGTTGRITFAGGNDPQRSVPVSTVRDGRLEIVRVIDPP
ncbi:MAG TPA: ABC transporter substrate-binding protein, partial [Gemmatimonadales bacterium]|nr:ABC transporter substrate-binding protein [Gemmatimonadales bacterium]